MSTAHPDTASGSAPPGPEGSGGSGEPGEPGKPGVGRIGCVSYLNAKPLIDGLESLEDPTVRFDVPSRLLADLEAGLVDVALCPVIDYYRSRVPLVIVPVGGIGCDGPTLTVRLFSRIPLNEVSEVYADTDSHTSVALMQVLLQEMFSRRPVVIDYNAHEQVANHRVVIEPPTVLLIGDKVVTAAPSTPAYPHQMDLGEAWRDLTGLPFVFAVWMARAGASLGDLPNILDDTRRLNAERIDAIVARHAAAHGWDAGMAQQYLGRNLRFGIGARELEAMARFGHMARQLGLIEQVRDLQVYRQP